MIPALGLLIPVGTAAMALIAAERADKVVGRHDMRESLFQKWFEPENRAELARTAARQLAQAI